MQIIRSVHAIFVTGALMASALACASGSGSVVWTGQSAQMRDAYAYNRRDDFTGAILTEVEFTDQQVDAAKVNAAKGSSGMIRPLQLPWGAQYVYLSISDEKITRIAVSLKRSGDALPNSCCTLTLTRNDGNRIEGTLRSKEKKPSATFVDLKFALDLGSPDLGTPLPTDGGEPGKAYRAYDAALVKGDVEGVSKLMMKMVGDALLEHRHDADFKAKFETTRSRAILNPKIENGWYWHKGEAVWQGGETAVLQVSGKNGSGIDVKTGVSMVEEDGAWRVREEAELPQSTH